MPNRRYNTQVANPMKSGGRVKRMGGGMSTARKDMKSGYYKDDMGMKGGAMYKKGGSVKKKRWWNGWQNWRHDVFTWTRYEYEVKKNAN